MQVLLGHLVWVVMACRILSVRLAPFFPPPLGNGAWMTLRWRTLWAPWVAGGYFLSLLSYNTLDHLSVSIASSPIGESAAESVVSQLLTPGKGDLAALAIGALGPCVTAPIFEEILYRGFLLPALVRFMPLRLALPVHAALFGLHHQSLRGLLPLSALGLIWGMLYVASGNLLVPILVHAMWNSRIFLHALLM